MITRLLIFSCFGFLSVNAQTTYDLDWYRGIGTSVDLTIDIGDTVKWTWGDDFPHTVQNVVGSSVENFNSGTKTGAGLTYSHTFTVEGVNDYYCGIHGVLNMSGTITVNPNLGINDETYSSFKMYPNPSSSILRLVFPPNISNGDISVFDILGKEYLTQKFENTDSVELNISNWIQGIYLIKVKSETVSQTKQFIRN